MARDAYLTLAQAMRTYLGANEHAVEVSVGLRARFELVNQGPGGANRIVLIPGRYNGEELPAILDGGTFENRLGLQSIDPRELVQVSHMVTLSIWGVDTSAPQDEGKQQAATNRILELAKRAVHNALDPLLGDPLGADRDSEGNDTWRDFSRVYHSLESGFGLELLVRFEMQGPLFDAPQERVYPQVGALSKTLTASTTTG
jgi:hypothetical protein